MPATIICPDCGCEDVPMDGSEVECPDCGKPFGDLDGLGGGATAAASLTGDEPEKSVESKVMRLYEEMGCKVYKTSQPQKPVGMTKGIPDLLVYRDACPRRVAAAWWHEVKRTDDPEEVRRLQTEEQYEFEEHALSCGMPYLLGGVEVARDYLAREG